MDASSAAATLSASVKAAEGSPDDQPVLEKARSTMFYSLATLRAALRVAKLPKSLEINPQGPPWIEGCRVAVEDAIMSKNLVANIALRFWLINCLTATFSFSAVAHHLYGTVKAFLQVAIAKASPSSCRTCVIDGLGALFLLHGGRLSSLSSDMTNACARQLPLRDLALRQTAMDSINRTLEGVGSSALPDSITADVLRAINGSSKDKAPEVRSAAARALATLALNSPGGVSSSSSSGSTAAPPAGAVPLETTLALCVKGLEDASIQVKLAFADTVATLLSVGVDDHATAAALRAKDASRVDKAEAAEDAKAKEVSRGSFDKAFKSLTRATTDKKRGDGSFTLQSAVGHLCALFTRANTRSQRSGTVAAMVALLKLQMRRGLDVGLPENAWIVSSLVSLLASPRWGHSENTSATAGVAYVIRGGISAHASEQQQTWLLSELLKCQGSEWQLQVVLSEASHLTTALSAAVLPLADMLRGFCWRCLDHREYSVRFEAATTLASLLRACPHLSMSLLSQALREMVRCHDELIQCSVPPSNAPATADPKTKVNEAEKKKSKMYGLHGRATVLTVCIQGVEGLSANLPLHAKKGVPEEGEEFHLDALVKAASDLIAREFDKRLTHKESMGVLCTCVRAGWYLMSACFGFGEVQLFKLLKTLLATWKKSLDRVAASLKAAQLPNATRTFEATHELVCIDASLGCLLCLVRGSPQVFFKEPVVLSMVTNILRKLLEFVRPGKGKLATSPSVQASKQGKFRLNLVSAELLETYAWLPPGSYPNQAESLCQMACEIFLSCSNDDWVESALLPTLLNEEDAPLGMHSSNYSAHQSSLDMGGLDELLAMQAQLSGIPLDNIERELAVYSPSWSPVSVDDGASGSGFGGGFGDDLKDDVRIFGRNSFLSEASLSRAIDRMGATCNSTKEAQPTPMHGATWRLPPAPSPRLETRLTDAAVLVIAATFACQDDNYQACLVGAFIELLNERTALSALGSVLSSDEDRRKRDRKQSVVQHNVATALLAILRSLPAHADSEMNVSVPWVVSSHGALLSLLKSPSDSVRRAAGEGLALLATKMGTMYQAQLLQQLVELLRCAPGSSDGGYMGRRSGSIGSSLSSLGVTNSAATAITGLSSSGASGAATGTSGGTGSTGGGLGNTGGGVATEMDLLCAGTVFALACLKRSAPAIEAGGFWHELETQLGVDGSPPAQPLRSWALYALTIVARSLDLGLAHQARVRNMLQGMTALLESHFLGAWGVAGSPVGNPHEAAMLVSLVRLTETMIPMIQSLAPNQALVSRFDAVCFGVVDILPHLGAHPRDPRVHFEVLQTADILATFYPQSVALDTEQTFNYPSLALSLCTDSLEDPINTSPVVVSFALKSLSRLMMSNPTLISEHRLDTLVLNCLSQLISASTCPRCSIWRALFVASRVEDHYRARTHCTQLAAHVFYQACLLDCSLPNMPRRQVHWLLLARGLVVSTAPSSVAARGNGVTKSNDSSNKEGVEVVEEDSDEEEGVEPEVFLSDTDYKAVCAETLDVAVAAVSSCSFAGSPRWQLRWLSLFTARLALNEAVSSAQGIQHTNVKLARHQVETMLSGQLLDAAPQPEFESFEAFSDSPPVASPPPEQAGEMLYDKVGDFASLHIDAIIATACSASTFILGDDLGLGVLQRQGLLFLGDAVAHFSLSIDPDVLEEEGRHDESILMQYTSQISSSIRPSLAIKDSPRLVAAGLAVLVLAVSNGLITDVTRFKRLITSVRTCPAPSSSPTSLDAILGILRPSPLVSVPAQVVLEDHVIRLISLAHICVLADKEKKLMPSASGFLVGQVPIPISECIASAFTKDSQLFQQWACLVMDALRGKQNCKKQGQVSHGLMSASSLKGRVRYLAENNWAVLAAAYAVATQGISTVNQTMSTMVAAMLTELPSAVGAAKPSTNRNRDRNVAEHCLASLSILLFRNDSRVWTCGNVTCSGDVEGPPASAFRPFLESLVASFVSAVDVKMQLNVMNALLSIYSSEFGARWAREAFKDPTGNRGSSPPESIVEENGHLSLQELLIASVVTPLQQCIPWSSLAHKLVFNTSEDISQGCLQGALEDRLELVGLALKLVSRVLPLCDSNRGLPLELLLATTIQAMLSCCFVRGEMRTIELLNIIRKHGHDSLSHLCNQLRLLESSVQRELFDRLSQTSCLAATTLLKSRSSDPSGDSEWSANAFKFCIESWLLVIKAAPRLHAPSLEILFAIVGSKQAASADHLSLRLHTGQILRNFTQQLLQQQDDIGGLKLLGLLNTASPFCLGFLIDAASDETEDVISGEVLGILLLHHSAASTGKPKPILPLLISTAAKVLKVISQSPASSSDRRLKMLLAKTLTHFATTSGLVFRDVIISLSPDLQLELKAAMKEHMEKASVTQKGNTADVSRKNVTSAPVLKKIDMSQYSKKK